LRETTNIKPWWWVFAQSVVKITIEVTPQNLNAEEMEDLVVGDGPDYRGYSMIPQLAISFHSIKSNSQRQVPSWDSAVGT